MADPGRGRAFAVCRSSLCVPYPDDYTLSPSSPAFSLGFVAFDPTQAGRESTATLQAPASAGYPALLTGVYVMSPSVARATPIPWYSWPMRPAPLRSPPCRSP